MHVCNHNHGPHETSRSLPTALQLVTALSGDDYQQLCAFAAKRLRRLHQPLGGGVLGKSAEDLVHDALHKVLLGEAHPKKGRKLSMKNRADTDAFIRCLQGIINSDLSNAVRSAEMSIEHVPLDAAGEDVTVVQPAAREDFAQKLERRDLQRELFRRMRQQAAPELLPIIDHWEPRYHSDDCIAHNEFDRRQVHRVRILAREILQRLAGELGSPTARAMELFR